MTDTVHVQTTSLVPYCSQSGRPHARGATYAQ